MDGIDVACNSGASGPTTTSAVRARTRSFPTRIVNAKQWDQCLVRRRDLRPARIRAIRAEENKYTGLKSMPLSDEYREGLESSPTAILDLMPQDLGCDPRQCLELMKWRRRGQCPFERCCAFTPGIISCRRFAHDGEKHIREEDNHAGGERISADG